MLILDNPQQAGSPQTGIQKLAASHTYTLWDERNTFISIQRLQLPPPPLPLPVLPPPSPPSPPPPPSGPSPPSPPSYPPSPSLSLLPPFPLPLTLFIVLSVMEVCSLPYALIGPCEKPRQQKKLAAERLMQEARPQLLLDVALQWLGIGADVTDAIVQVLAGTSSQVHVGIETSCVLGIA